MVVPCPYTRARRRRDTGRSRELKAPCGTPDGVPKPSATVSATTSSASRSTPRGLAEHWNRRRLAEETGRLLVTRGDALREHLVTDVIPVQDAPEIVGELARRERGAGQVVFDFTAPSS